MALPSAKLCLLLVVGGLGCAASRQTTNALAPCDGRRMARVVNLSSEPVEAVAVLGNTERVLALAPAGLASPPFQPPRPEDLGFVRPGEPRRSFWFIRNVATRQQIGTRDPKVQTDWVCVT